MTYSTLISRALSLLIAVSYLVALLASGGKLHFGLVIVVACLVFFVSLVWYAEWWADFGVGMMVRWSRVSGPSPVWMVRAAGWGFLLLPWIVFLTAWLAGA